MEQQLRQREGGAGSAEPNAEGVRAGGVAGGDAMAEAVERAIERAMAAGDATRLVQSSQQNSGGE